MRGGLWPGILAVCLASCGKEEERTLQALPTPKAQLVVSESPLFDFGTKPVGSVTEKTFFVTNKGDAVASSLSGSFYLSITFGYTGGAFPGTGGDCGPELLPAKSCRVVVAFAPTYAGSFEESLRLSYFDGTETRFTEKPFLRGVGSP